MNEPKTAPVRDAYFKLSEDEIVRKRISESGTPIEIDDGPTVLSFLDTIAILKRKYGDDWFQNPVARCIAVWNSSVFLEEHIKEVTCPEFYNLSMEYRKKGTINGHKLPPNFGMLAFSLFDWKAHVYESL